MDVLEILPDEPACVEARGMVLSGRGRIVWRDDDAIVLHAPAEHLATIAGRFRWSYLAPVLHELGGNVEIVTREAEFDLAGPLPEGWRAEGALVHEEPTVIPAPPGGRPVTFFTRADPPDLRHVPGALRRELESALAFSPIAAAIDGDVSASFCYSGWESETLWDVSIDTLEPWRGRGFAAAAAIALMTHMRRQGKRAVWAAHESNVASLGLARRLGFRPVGRLVVVRRVFNEGPSDALGVERSAVTGGHRPRARSGAE
jgi:GNAT superfamily N-acetyltransferase